jgi:hypothetical protein
MKALVCPPLLGISPNVRGEFVEWGIVEYIQDVLLPGALGTVEHCDAALRVLTAIKGLRGPKQVGVRLEFEDADCALLVGLARQPRQGIGPENLVAMATYNRALMLAETVKPAQQAAE